jgi:hypothetical protein
MGTSPVPSHELGPGQLGGVGAVLDTADLRSTNGLPKFQSPRQGKRDHRQDRHRCRRAARRELVGHSTVLGAPDQRSMVRPRGRRTIPVVRDDRLCCLPGDLVRHHAPAPPAHRGPPRRHLRCRSRGRGLERGPSAVRHLPVLRVSLGVASWYVPLVDHQLDDLSSHTPTTTRLSPSSPSWPLSSHSWARDSLPSRIRPG